MCALNRMYAEHARGMAEGEGPAGSTSYVDSTSSSESEDGDREVTSILDVLKAPKVSVQNRKWKVE
jgi:hypothetical protein